MHLLGASKIYVSIISIFLIPLIWINKSFASDDSYQMHVNICNYSEHKLTITITQDESGLDIEVPQDTVGAAIEAHKQCHIKAKAIKITANQKTNGVFTFRLTKEGDSNQSCTYTVNIYNGEFSQSTWPQSSDGKVYCAFDHMDNKSKDIYFIFGNENTGSSSTGGHIAL